MSQNIIKINEIKPKIFVVSTDKDLIGSADIDIYLSEMNKFYSENFGRNVVVIYDISVIKAVDAKGRIKIGEWLKENATEIKDTLAGACYVQTNVFQKIILQGIFTVKKPEWEHKIVGSFDEAVNWAENLLN